MSQQPKFIGSAWAVQSIAALMDLLRPRAESAVVTHAEMGLAIRADTRVGRGKRALYVARRKLLRDEGLLFVADPGIGVHRATPPEKVEHGARDLGTARRKTKLARRKNAAVTVEEFRALTAADQLRHNFTETIAAAQAVIGDGRSRRRVLEIMKSRNNAPLAVEESFKGVLSMMAGKE